MNDMMAGLTGITEMIQHHLYQLAYHFSNQTGKGRKRDKSQPKMQQASKVQHYFATCMACQTTEACALCIVCLFVSYTDYDNEQDEMLKKSIRSLSLLRLSF